MARKKLTELLQQAKSMKLLIDVEVIFDKLRQQDDEPIEENIQIKHNMRSRRYNILNVGDLKKALENIPKDIELQIENSPLKHSGLKINKINKITIHYDKYNPNRAGKYMELPEWISIKKHVSTFKMMMNYVLNIVFYVNFMKSSDTTRN